MRRFNKLALAIWMIAAIYLIAKLMNILLFDASVDSLASEVAKVPNHNLQEKLSQLAAPTPLIWLWPAYSDQLNLSLLGASSSGWTASGVGLAVLRLQTDPLPEIR